MEGLLSEAGKTVLSYGLLGVVALVGWIVAYKVNLSKETCTEARLGDVKEMLKTFAEMKRAMDSLTVAINTLSEKTESRDKNTTETLTTLIALRHDMERMKGDADFSTKAADKKMAELTRILNVRGHLG